MCLPSVAGLMDHTLLSKGAILDGARVAVLGLLADALGGQGELIKLIVGALAIFDLLGAERVVPDELDELLDFLACVV